jgi:hypothetical protein
MSRKAVPTAEKKMKPNNTDIIVMIYPPFEKSTDRLQNNAFQLLRLDCTPKTHFCQ